MALKDADRVGVDLDLPNAFVTGSLKSKIEASYTGKKREKSHLFLALDNLYR